MPGHLEAHHEDRRPLCPVQPGEIAPDLQLEAGGICNLEVRARPKGKAEVALMPYKDKPIYIRQFIIEGLDDYDEPLMRAIPLEEPITKGRSQAVNRQLFKSYVAASNLKYCFADFSIS